MELNADRKKNALILSVAIVIQSSSSKPLSNIVDGKLFGVAKFDYVNDLFSGTYCRLKRRITFGSCCRGICDILML